MSRLADLEGFDHRVTVDLEIPHDLETYKKQVEELQDWLEQISNWQPDQFRVVRSHLARRFHIWFRNEHHATLCRLKWS